MKNLIMSILNIINSTYILQFHLKFLSIKDVRIILIANDVY